MVAVVITIQGRLEVTHWGNQHYDELWLLLGLKLSRLLKGMCICQRPLRFAPLT